MSNEPTFPTTVDALRTALLELGEDESTVASMKKGELKSRYMELMSRRIDCFGLKDLTDESEEELVTLEQAVGVKYASDEWHDYIMSLFKPEELMDGYPKINGLRRVANLVLGDILSSRAVQVFVTHGEVKSVVVNYEIQIDWKLNTPVGFGNLGSLVQTRVFGGVADCNEDLSSAFGKHSSATAESKAEGRALRKALSLNIIAAEEMLTGGAEDGSSRRPSAPITTALKSVIEVKAKALNLNLEHVLKDWGTDKELSALTTEEGRNFFEFVNKYQQGK